MTQEQKRIKLAKAAGFIQEEPWLDGRKCWGHKNHPKHIGFEEIPDYFNDLNAMHKAEKMLRGHAQISAYVWELERLTHWKPDYREGGDGKQYISPAAYYCTTHATAAQRAEAIGLTLNLW
jgi:hypothetical protein